MLAHKGLRQVAPVPGPLDIPRAIRHGAAVRETFWTLGQYDIIAIVEAPDEMTMTALGLSLGGLGFVRTQTLRAFSETEMQTILRKMA